MDEYGKLISQAFESGLDAEDIVALHGTSIQVLKILLRKGVQPGTTYAKDNASEECNNVRRGDIFVYPILGKTDVIAHKGNLTERAAYHSLRGHNGILAVYHHFCEAVGWDLESLDDVADTEQRRLEVHEFLSEYVTGQPFQEQDEVTRDMMAYLQGIDYDQSRIDDLVIEARKREGIILGYGSRVFREGKPLPGNMDHDIRIQGVTIHDIIGIDPLDQEAYDFLEKLEV